jgi:hypothetical protein
MHPTLKRRSWGGNLGSTGKNVSRIERIVHNLLKSVCLSFFFAFGIPQPKVKWHLMLIHTVALAGPFSVVSGDGGVQKKRSSFVIDKPIQKETLPNRR